MATDEEARATRDAKLEQLHERLTAAVDLLVSGEDWKRALEFAARFRARSFRNTLLILAQHLDAYEQGRVASPEPSYVAGYKQWQSLGRQVERGQAGYVIFAPVTGRFASSNPADSESWRRLGRFEKPKPGEVVRSRMVGAKPAYVWDVSQTSGDPVPERPAPTLLEGEAPDGLWAGLASLVEAEGFTVTRVADEREIRGANGVTDYTNRTVAVRSNMDDAAQVKTLAHELAHVQVFKFIRTVFVPDFINVGVVPAVVDSVLNSDDLPPRFVRVKHAAMRFLPGHVEINALRFRPFRIPSIAGPELIGFMAFAGWS